MPWLSAAHRLLLRQVCVLATRIETGEDLSASSTHAPNAMLSKLGATPPTSRRLTIRWMRKITTSASSTELFKAAWVTGADPRTSH